MTAQAAAQGCRWEGLQGLVWHLGKAEFKDILKQKIFLISSFGHKRFEWVIKGSGSRAARLILYFSCDHDLCCSQSSIIIIAHIGPLVN